MAGSGARTLGVPGVALLTGSLGLWLAYAGIRDVPVVDGLRDALAGSQPQSRKTAGTAKAGGSWRSLDGPAGSGTPKAGGVGAPGTWQHNLSPSFAAKLERFAAASGGRVVLKAGSGWRSAERQIELRRQHCGTSQYAIYQMPSSQCSPPTARPGTSNHEKIPATAFDLTYATADGPSWARLNALRFGLRFPFFDREDWHIEDLPGSVMTSILGGGS